MSFIRPFSGIGKADAAIAGGKGASLGEMTQAGIPVPPGFVVVADAFERFTEETDLNVEIDAILRTVNTEEMHAVEGAAEKIQALILSKEMPKDLCSEIFEHFRSLDVPYVAVRSSATAEDSAAAAWAGQLDTYLNTTEETLLMNVQHCWASLFTPRAVFYRFEKKLHDTRISVAVVVQAMVASEVSGIAFSVHPVTEDRNQLIIEAGYGLGEAIVSGQVTPDSYVVTKEPREILDKNIATKERGLYRIDSGGNEWKDIPFEKHEVQALTDEEVFTLSEMVCRIENHYGFPCDIEWAMEGGKLFITQSRPITTLSATFNEAPSAAGAGGAQAPYHGLTFTKKGRWSTMPADNDTWHTIETSDVFEKKFGVWKEIFAVCAFEGEYANHMYVSASFVERLHARIADITANDPQGLAKILERFYTERDEIKARASSANPADLSSVSNNELIELYRINRSCAHQIVVYDQFTWLAEDYWPPLMDKVLVGKVGLTKDSSEYVDALYALIKPREISTTLLEKRAVIDIALKIRAGERERDEAAEALADEFGWMPVLAYGTPWDAVRYRQEIEDTLVRDDTDLKRERDELSRYTQLRDEAFEKVVKTYGLSETDQQVFVDFGLAIDTRNEAEYVASVCGFHLLPLYEEIGKRLGLSITELRTLYEGDIIACLRGEVEAVKLLEEKTKFVVWLLADHRRTNFSPEEGRHAFEYAEAQQKVVAANATRGITANRGRAKGIARLVFSPEDNHKVEQGDILIAFSTMVDNLPAMKKAAAMVTESGGLTCHAAVVAREFGVPCIVGLPGAMSACKDGDMIEIDADRGVIVNIG